MRKSVLHYLFLFIFLLVASCKEKPHSTVKKASPRTLYPGLFEDVQRSGVFPDSKTFPDCSPLKPPAEILEAYQSLKEDRKFNAAAFVKEHFAYPDSVKGNYKPSSTQDIRTHINSLWTTLSRQPGISNPFNSLIYLPHPYVVPGGRFREIYYWDSYFTMLGLQESGRYDLIEHMVNNFAWLIRLYGFVPNGNRTYYLTRSQPPYFSLMLKLLMDIKKEKADSVLKANIDALELEYTFWMSDRGIKKGAVMHVVHLPDGSVLNRYCDMGNWPREESYLEDVKTARRSNEAPGRVFRELRSAAESGWDFSSRWFLDGKSMASIHTTDVIPVDLNCLLYHHERMLQRAYAGKKYDKKRVWVSNNAEKRRSALLRFCWDDRSGYFRDFNWKTLKQTQSVSLAGAYPLYFKMVNQVRADLIAGRIRKDFLKAGGLVATTATTGEQWDAPNGWAPLHWMVISGLENYGNTALAKEIAEKWVKLNVKVFQKTGKLMEKYNVVDTTLIAGGGEYPTQDGFGWTNGVLLKLLEKR